MAWVSVDKYCGDLEELWWQSMRGLLDLMADAELSEAMHLVASCLVAREVGLKRVAAVEGCRAKLKTTLYLCLSSVECYDIKS